MLLILRQRGCAISEAPTPPHDLHFEFSVDIPSLHFKFPTAKLVP